MKAAVIYARVSTDDQLQHGTSLDTQAEACKRYAEQHGYTVLETFREQMSGAIWERPMLTQARELIRTGQASVLIAYAPDRLARDVAHLSILWKELVRHKAELHTVIMPVDQSTMGKAAFQMAGIFAEIEREQFRERSMRGKLERARRGQVFVSNMAPYGYDFADGKLTINEGEAAWVRKMYELCAIERLSCHMIARRLTEMGARAKRGGSVWRKATVHHFLRSTTYKGSWLFRSGSERLDVPVPAIVSEQLWNNAQERLEEGKHRTRRRTFNYLLTSRIKCALCGGSFLGTGGALHAYYGCSGRTRDGGVAPHCANRYYRADKLDERVWKAIEQTLSDPDMIMALFARSEDALAELTRLRVELEASDRKLRDFERRLSVLLDLIEQGDLTRDQFKERKARLDKERTGYEQLRNELAGRVAAASHTGMTREDAERLSRYWLGCRKYSGGFFLADANTGENAFDNYDFRLGVLDKLKAMVVIDGTQPDGQDVYLRGVFAEALVRENVSLYSKEDGRNLPFRKPPVGTEHSD